MGASNSLKNDLLKLILQAVDTAGIATSAGATEVELSLHTALPTSQSSNIATYTDYEHATVERSTDGWDVDEDAHEASNAEDALWPTCDGDETPVEYSHVGISLSSVLRFTVELPEPIVVFAQVRPRAEAGTLIVRAV